MATALIANPNNAFGQPLPQIAGADPMQNNTNTIVVQNNSAAARQYGDVVVVDVTGNLANTTTSANDKKVLGVVAQQPYGATIPVANTVDVVVNGVARINVAANAVAVGDILCASAVAAVAIVNNAATVGQAIAIALEASAAKDTNNTIRALIGKL